ncbi:MAG: RNA polymerase sigma factor [Deltaproteobacteria bacterium]|nr:RNA polymerase sigma factor [Deltaproteobacteria bacterium]
MRADTDNPIKDEKRLVALLKEGDETAFRLLIRTYRSRLYAIAYGITLDREESLDIVQDVFIKVYEKIHTFRGESSLATWLHRITVNLCLNWKRRWTRRFRWHHQPLEKEDGMDYPELGTSEGVAEQLYEQKELKHLLWRQLQQLPGDARAVFVLKEVEGLSYDEIAKALNIKKGTVSSRLFYARKRLRTALGKVFKNDVARP